MLDFDLAGLYEVPTKVLNQAVKRNSERFPEDFMFRLTDQEWSWMWSQIVTGSARISWTKRPPQDIGKTAKGLVSKGERDNLTVPLPYGLSPAPTAG